MTSERQWIEWLRRAAAAGGGKTPARAGVRLGIGDDAALLRFGRGFEAAVTTDLFLEGVHFSRAYDPAAVCGYRCAARALSDLAAMGAAPVALLLSAAFPAGLASAWRRGFHRGFLAAAKEAGAALAGGDLAAMPSPTAARAAGGRGAARSGAVARELPPPVVADVVGLGRVPAGRALLRSGARPGDRIYVSGALGLAARGRELAAAGRAPWSDGDRAALARHRRPRARWELGRALASRLLASAALDISDGFALDLHRLCAASRVGAVIDAAALPCLPGAEGLRLALTGGEDYELLFTAPRAAAPALRRWRNPPLAAVGEVRAARGLWLRSRDGALRRLPAGGWEYAWGHGPE